MNADAVVRALQQLGEDMTFRRLTGTQRVAFDVVVRAHVVMGGVNILVGGVLQTGDLIRLTNREMKAAQWPAPPRHGDQIVFADGRVSAVQGRVQIYHLEEDDVYNVHTLGG